MQVDFNNLRRQLAYTYGRIATRMNKNITVESGRKMIYVDVEGLQKDMDQLRSLVVGLCCCYQEGKDDIRSVIDEVGAIACFNDEDEGG